MPKLAKSAHHSMLWTLALVLILSLSACEPEDPVQRIAKMRANYVVQVNPSGLVAEPHVEPEPEVEALDGADMDIEGGEVVDEVVVEAETPGTADDAPSEGDAEGDAAEGEGTEDVAAEPTGYDVLLDILVQNKNDEALPQLTIDIVQTDRSENEIARFYHTLDTSNLLKGMDTQLSHKLENIPYDPANHMFYVEVRGNIPESEYPLYPEFPQNSGSGAGSGQ